MYLEVPRSQQKQRNQSDVRVRKIDLLRLNINSASSASGGRPPLHKKATKERESSASPRLVLIENKSFQSPASRPKKSIQSSRIANNIYVSAASSTKNSSRSNLNETMRFEDKLRLFTSDKNKKSNSSCQGSEVQSGSQQLKRRCSSATKKPHYYSQNTD